MGKDKKTKAAGKKARVAQKQSKKASQKEKKVKARGGAGAADDDSDAEDVDLDAVLAEYARQQAQFLKVTEAACEGGQAPSARSSATLIGSPANSNELFMFGGEHYNGGLATFHNDLFVYLVDRDEWRQVTSPNTPLPRSGHAWCRGGNAGAVWLFGGEFSSPKQGTFYHYNDFWRLDPASREWSRVESSGGGGGKGKNSPPARSGHRMTYFKNYILLFGGFQDTSQQTKYLQDLWIYDCLNFVWYNPVLPPATQKPDARSSFSFLPHESGAVLYGGYSRIKETANAGKQTKGGGQGTRTVMKPVVHQDTWFLRVTPPPADAPQYTAPAVRWERRKRPANAPNPARAGATMAYHRGRGILFGGVHDVEESEEAIESEFFNLLYAWNIDRNRFFQLTIRQPRTAAKRPQAQDRGAGGRRGRGKADEEELLRNLAALETGASITDANTDSMQIDGKIDGGTDVDEPVRAAKEVKMELPHGRFNAQLAVQDDVLYIYGGTYENGDREYTFDDMWSVDLGKLDGVKTIFHRDLENWQGSEDGESDEDDDADDDDDDDDDDEEEAERGDDANVEPMDVDDRAVADSRGHTPSAAQGPAKLSDRHDSDEEEPDISEPLALRDALPHPRPFENLRDFFTRTSTQWQEILLEQLRTDTADGPGKSVKELRKVAFDRAEGKWWDCREEIQAMEDEQEEAGIGDIVSITDRAGTAGAGAGQSRRR
ncbi:MAG: hypothetical protein M1825_001775 [Sarcosagium campestre]|nr:MAG: hypothetical protein M1825_001775 [Sarcosagium campestre]